MAEQTIKNIIAVNCGNVNTTAILIEQEGGSYRLKGTNQVLSSYGEPWNDISWGIQEAIRGLELQVDRTLLTSGGRPITPQNINHQGVDALLFTASAGEPLAVALVGLVHEISLDSARRATSTTYTNVTAEISLDAAEFPQQTTIEGQLQAIQANPPEAILLVGGTDGGAEQPLVDMTNLVSMALHILPEGSKPAIIYAGNTAMQPQVHERLGQHVTVVDNIRPSLDTENLAAPQTELERLYIQRRLSRLSGVQTLTNWSAHPLMPVSKSFETVISYLGQHNHLNVIGADVGSRATMISTQAANFHGSTIRSDAGIGHGLGSLLKQVSLDLFDRWLPFEIDPYELYNYLLNRSLSPASIPTTVEDLMIEQAIVRESLRLVVGQARLGWPLHHELGDLDPQWSLLVGSGQALAAAPHPGQAALMLLDGLEPWGVMSLVLDKYGLSSMLGAIATVEPTAAVEITHNDTFLNLGTVVAPAGHGQIGKTALKLKITTAEGETETHEVPYGLIQRLPLAADETVTLEVKPSPDFDIVPGYIGESASTEVSGGALGLIIDTRGRPLKLPENGEKRHTLLKQWMEQIMEEGGA